MDKQQLQQAIILADRAGQKKKNRRTICLITVLSIGIFMFCGENLPLWQNILVSLFGGALSFYILAMAIAFFCTATGIDLTTPEDRELQYLLKLYREEFGENFVGPWSR